MDEHQLVLVEWEDSAQPVPAWRWLSECNEFGFVVCQSVGCRTACGTIPIGALACGEKW